MKRGELFWAVVLIVVGGLLLLGQFVHVNVWQFFWPAILIGLGLWMILGSGRRQRPLEREEVAIPLEGVERARINVKYGAGRLSVSAGAGADELVSGTFVGGLSYDKGQSGDTTEIEMRPPKENITPSPWLWGHVGGLDWDVRLNGDVPLSLILETGAASARLDLSDLRVTEFVLKTGASSTEVRLPAAAGSTRVRIESGIASVALRIPAGVAARVRSESGLASVQVDAARFPRTAGGYESPDYDVAENKVDILVKTGLGSVSIR